MFGGISAGAFGPGGAGGVGGEGGGGGAGGGQFTGDAPEPFDE